MGLLVKDSSPQATTLLLVALLAIFIGSISCSGNSRTVPSSHPNAPSLSNLARDISALNNPAETRLSPAFLDQIRQTGSQYQRDLVTDGSLTLEEYEKAELAYASCMQEAGYQLQPGSTELNGLARIDVAVGPFSDLQAERQSESACRGKYVSALELPWSYITAAIQQRVMSASRQFMATCIAGEGLKVSQRPWSSDDPTVQRKYDGCTKRMFAKFNIQTSFGVDGDQNYRDSGSGGDVIEYTPTPGRRAPTGP